MENQRMIKNLNQFKTDITEEGRVCTACLQFKTWDNYTNQNKAYLNVKKASKCKECASVKLKSRDRTKETLSSKARAAKLKKENPYLYKARTTRSRMLGRVPKELKETTPTAEEFLEWFKSQELVCYYSGIKLDLFKLHVDHKTPIARGGTNELSNLCLASHHMNTAKGRMTEDEFWQLLELISTWEDKGESLLRRLKQGHFG